MFCLITRQIAEHTIDLRQISEHTATYGNIHETDIGIYDIMDEADIGTCNKYKTSIGILRNMHETDIEV